MKTFVSFDFENDRHFKYILSSWNANPNIDFDFEDGSSREINSCDVCRVKAALTIKIRQADSFLVIIGKHSDSLHKDAELIGYKNWQYFEIAKAIEADKKIVAVKLDRTYATPDLLYKQGVLWAMSFTLDSIKTAIHKAKYGR